MSSSTSAKRPIEITDFKEVIRDLPDSQLQQIRAELTNSISHLDRSNSRLRKYIAKIEGKREDTPDGVEEDELDKIDENDLQLYQDSHRENEIVMRNYNERLDALDQEEAYRGGHVKTKDIGASPQTGIASQKKPRAPSFDTDNTNGDTNAPNSVYL
ncbi:LAMI_0E02850g1_1 [Lachancea mirantina]|uniref:LAMI_0E02850g1_1 n=1 Tax=Lachancea mirantina TaxID=1230905 RepID=A0A1G4JJE0_9SACH|nr:LAMI_0E02850g1_1 [Lachancea mirantina]